MRLRHSLLLILLGFSLVATAAMDLVGGLMLHAAMRRQATEHLLRESEFLVRHLGHELTLPGEDLPVLVGSLASALDVRVTIVDPEGVVIADSDVPTHELADLDNHGDRPEIREALDRGTGSSERMSATLGVSLSYLARALHGPGGSAGVLRLALPTSRLEKGAGSLRLTYDVMALGALLLLGGLAYLLTGRALRPMEKIARAADRAASGGYSKSLARTAGSVEIQALGASMDRMRKALLQRIEELAGQHRMLDAILSGMSEGLLVVDSGRRVILANAAIRRSLGLGESHVEGRMMAEVIRDPVVGGAFMTTLEERKECRRPVDLTFPSERSFELLVEPLDSPEGGAPWAIGIFVDVTRLKALEQVRRTFVADFSHEMRTPLASVQAAIETIEDDSGMAEADRSHFFEILRRNLDRIRGLLEHLTDLSSIETGAIPLHRESVILSDVVLDVLASLQTSARSAGVRLTSTVPEDLRIEADRRRLDQILLNVIENAIKFNRAGGSVEIGATLDGDRIRVRVVDSGPGIPAAERDRVFQRFYRMDRSRSGATTPGRGLGLAIVKHLMRLHSGTAHAEDGPAGGTSIVLTFPVSDPALQVEPEP